MDNWVQTATCRSRAPISLPLQCCFIALISDCLIVVSSPTTSASIWSFSLVEWTWFKQSLLDRRVCPFNPHDGHTISSSFFLGGGRFVRFLMTFFPLLAGKTTRYIMRANEAKMSMSNDWLWWNPKVRRQRLCCVGLTLFGCFHLIFLGALACISRIWMIWVDLWDALSCSVSCNHHWWMWTVHYWYT